MTSMPASRRARAMIFAPRSWPSRPGFAITTLILRATGRQVYGREADRRWLLARLAEPRRSAVRLPRRGARPAPARLRDGGPVEAPRARRGLAADRRDRDLPLAPRPLGRPRPVDVGLDGRPQQARRALR